MLGHAPHGANSLHAQPSPRRSLERGRNCAMKQVKKMTTWCSELLRLENSAKIFQNGFKLNSSANLLCDPRGASLWPIQATRPSSVKAGLSFRVFQRKRTTVELFSPACLFELELCSILVMVSLGRSEYVSVINSSDERGLVYFPYKITGGGWAPVHYGDMKCI